MIELQNINYQYGPKGQALENINLQFRPGESVALMGPNGSGKTTLVRCLNGLLVPDQGECLVDAMSTRDEAKLFEIRRRVGMVFQNPDNQIVSATVEREIAFGMENLGFPRQKMFERVELLLDRFGLSRYKSRSPHCLSGGEKQRLALATVLAMEPKYLVLDEPTSLLDPASRRDILSIIHELATPRQDHTPITTLFVTQFPHEALEFDRLLVLYHGKIVADDKPRTVFDQIEKLESIGLAVPESIVLEKYLVKAGLISKNQSPE